MDVPGGLYLTEVIPALPGLLLYPEMPALLEDLAQPEFYPGPADGLYLSVMCREAWPFTDRERAERGPHRLRRIGLGPIAHARCEAWDVAPAAASTRDPARSATPVLLITGELDPITPPAWAELAAQTLARAQVVEIPGAGHDASALPCPQDLVAQFPADPNAPVDADCVDVIPSARLLLTRAVAASAARMVREGGMKEPMLAEP